MPVTLTPDAIKDALKHQRVMLVGGAGFIGHHLALELRRYGVETMVVDNLMLNNLVTNVSDANLDPLRRELYHGFLLQRFEAMRAAKVHIRTGDAPLSREIAVQDLRIEHSSAAEPGDAPSDGSSDEPSDGDPPEVLDRDLPHPPAHPSSAAPGAPSGARKRGRW